MKMSIGPLRLYQRGFLHSIFNKRNKQWFIGSNTVYEHERIISSAHKYLASRALVFFQVLTEIKITLTAQK